MDDVYDAIAPRLVTLIYNILLIEVFNTYFIVGKEVKLLITLLPPVHSPSPTIRALLINELM